MGYIPVPVLRSFSSPSVHVLSPRTSLFSYVSLLLYNAPPPFSSSLLLRFTFFLFCVIFSFSVRYEFLSPTTGIVGYCLKDQGRPHFRSQKKGVSNAEDNTALLEYRRLRRQTVSDHRGELGGKNSGRSCSASVRCGVHIPAPCFLSRTSQYLTYFYCIMLLHSALYKARGLHPRTCISSFARRNPLPTYVTTV